ncbi:hypothetical protein COCNU_06G006790 [Cocos nucifera]|uniref:Uncharacterized protein n=1 Tax=Cocos nucifera TaxID=13894 RepID=A0A8K0IBE0_COCNU|nr:hypothetical protein COCNU_06G006790 [Cocos nucifera]
MRASSSSTSYNDCTVSDAKYRKDILKEQGSLPVENTKSKEADMLSIDVHQSTESVGAENGRCKIINSVVQKKMKLFDAKAAASDTLSVHKLLDSSAEREKFDISHIMNSENVNSELNHFPMFDINRKIESILNPKKRTGNGAATNRFSESQKLLNETKLVPRIIEFASEEQQLDAKRMTGKKQEIGPSKSIKGFLHCQDDLTGAISHSAIDGLEFLGSDMSPSGCTRGESDPLISEHVIKDHSLNATLTSLEHAVCDCFSHSAFMISEMKGDDKMISSNFMSSWPMVNSGSMQIPRDSGSGDFPFPLLAREHNEELLNVPGGGLLASHKSFPVLNGLDDIGCLHYSAVYLLITKKIAMDLSHGEQMVDKSKKTTKVKGSATSEKLTSVTIPEYKGKQAEDLQPLENSSSSGDREHGIGTDTYLLETQNESPLKTDTMHIGVLQAPSSPAGETSSRVQEGVVCPNLSKSQSMAASPIKQAVSKEVEIELPYTDVEHHTSSDGATFMSNREMSTSRTESMDTVHILSHVEKPNNSDSSTLMEIPVHAEASSGWVKRLRHNPSNFLAIGTKRFKIGDGQLCREGSNLFSRVLNYSKSNSVSMKYLQDQWRFDKIMLSPDNGVNSFGPSVKHSWIRRWCHNCPQEKRATSPEVIYDDKQFPSIAAMALMGKAIKNFQPCEFQRRGSFVVWKIRDSEDKAFSSSNE